MRARAGVALDPVTVDTPGPVSRRGLGDAPVAAAAGAGFELAGGGGAFVVDIGGGTTEIAVVIGGRLVRAESLRLGGNAMDDAIVQAVKTELGLLLGRNAARRLKMALGLTGDTPEVAEVVGVDLGQGIPRGAHIHGDLLTGARERIVATIADAVRWTLPALPPALPHTVANGR